MTLKRSLLLALVFALGCATAAIVKSPVTFAQAHPSAGAPKWEQFCSYRAQGGSQQALRETNEDLLKYGKEGWELASTNLTMQPFVFSYCLKRPLVQ